MTGSTYFLNVVPAEIIWFVRRALVSFNTVGAQSIAPAQSIAHGQIGDSISQKN